MVGKNVELSPILIVTYMSCVIYTEVTYRNVCGFRFLCNHRKKIKVMKNYMLNL